MLQADSDEMYQAWISSMQQGIGAAIQLSMHEENNPSSLGCESSSRSASNNYDSLSLEKSREVKQRKAR